MQNKFIHIKKTFQYHTLTHTNKTLFKSDQIYLKIDFLQNSSTDYKNIYKIISEDFPDEL